jgi:putative membrane protein
MLDTILTSAIKALPVFAAHFGVTLLILIGGVLIYQALTPQAETRLIRENNVAAATAFGAAILSLALPLAMCLARSVSIPDIIVWGVVALVVQLATFFIAAKVFHGLVERIERGEMASAVALSATHLGVAFINAAAIAG